MVSASQKNGVPSMCSRCRWSRATRTCPCLSKRVRPIAARADEFPAVDCTGRSLAPSEQIVLNLQRPGWSGEKRTRQVLPPSQNPSTSFVSPSGDVKTTLSETSCNAFEYTRLLLNDCSNRPHLATTAVLANAAALGTAAASRKRHTAANRDQVKDNVPHHVNSFPFVPKTSDNKPCRRVKR